MKRLASVLALLALPACATPRGGAEALGMPEIRTVTAGAVDPSGQSVATTFRYEEEPVLVQEVVPGGPGQVLLLLYGAYLGEGLEPDGMDAASGLIALERAEWSGDRNGTPLSALLDCGLSATGRPMADDARVVASLAAQVREAGPGSSRVILRLSASAYPHESLGGRVRACVTTGVLERAILERMQAASADGAASAPGGADAEPATEAPAEAAGRPAPTAPSPWPAAYAAEGGAALGLSPGDRLRVWLAPDERVTGAFLQFRADSLVLGTSRRTPIPLGGIQGIEVKRTRRAALAAGALLGVAAGVTLATTTDLGIVGKHGIQGRKLNPGLGALAGGVAGILLADRTFGSVWVAVPLGVIRAR